ncbi:hypothetical protein GOODEAATRI_024941 [Goodea atripinnis]|uniref:Serine-threonine/tyrosine-protein kinase catalytic domain-containing protein n=1 Tax=Goodea atripinnis TaxID=208336 RepID=A0ABV0MUW7_9TELE
MITEYCSHGDLLNFLRAHAQDFMASVITVDEVGDEVFYKNVTQQEKLRSDSGISCWSEYQEMQPALFPGQNDQGKSPYPNVVVDTNFYKMIKDGHHMEQPEYHLMKLCWSLEPTHRPTFKTIGQLIKSLLPLTNDMLPCRSDQNVSINDAIVDPPRASIQDFSGVWHNHRGYCCYVFCVAQHSSLRTIEPTVTPADVSSDGC